MTADEEFLIAPHPEHERVWLLGGGSGHGFKHGPALAELVRDLLIGVQEPLDAPRTGRTRRRPGADVRDPRRILISSATLVRPPRCKGMRKRFCSAAIGTLATLAVVAAPAGADSLVASAPGARNVTQGGGWLAWVQPSGARWRIATRSPSGTVSRPGVRSFDAAPASRSALTSTRSTAAACSRVPALRRHRRAHALRSLLPRPRAGTERKLTGASSAACSETAPSIYAGSLGFVRRGRGCPRPGIYRQAGTRAAQRISRRSGSTPASTRAGSPTRTARRRASGSRCAGISGEGEPIVLMSGSPDQPRSLIYGRYTAAWLLPASGEQALFMSSRISGSLLRGTPLRQGNRLLPASTDSISGEDGHPTRYLDADGVKSMSPPLF